MSPGFHDCYCVCLSVYVFLFAPFRLLVAVFQKPGSDTLFSMITVPSTPVYPAGPLSSIRLPSGSSIYTAGP